MPTDPRDRGLFFFGFPMRLFHRALHPAHRLCCWLLAVVAIQSLSNLSLVLALAALPLLGRTIVLRWLRLVYRARWLLLTLLMVVGWGVAGEAVWEQGGLWSPTHEGLAEAANQLGRLVLVLAAVAALLETTPMARLMAGMHVLLRPFSICGLDTSRAVVRLSLALYYAEQMPAADWKKLLVPGRSAESFAVTGPQVLGLDLPEPRLSDWFAVLVMSILLTGICLA